STISSSLTASSLSGAFQRLTVSKPLTATARMAHFAPTGSIPANQAIPPRVRKSRAANPRPPRERGDRSCHDVIPFMKISAFSHGVVEPRQFEEEGLQSAVVVGF